MNVSVSKVWNDAGDKDGIRPKELSIQLYANGEEEGDPVSLKEKDGKWEYTWKNLDVLDADGKKITYTAKETVCPDGYRNNEKSVTLSGTTVSVRSAVDEGKVNVDVLKQWADDKPLVDSITVQLLADGKALEGKTAVLDAENKWSAQFSDLSAEKDGEDIIYSVKEIAAAGFTSDDIDLSGNDPVKAGNIKIEKEPNPWRSDYTFYTVSWDGADDAKPESIDLQLYIGGNPGTTITLNSNNNWKVQLNMQTEIRNEKGELQPQAFRVTAVNSYPIGGITAAGSTGFVLTNTHYPVQIRVRKVSEKDTDKGLPGAVYGLYEVKDGEGAMVDQASSDEDGYMTFSKIRIGSIYYIQEISAPDHYQLDPDPGRRFTVKLTGDGKAAIFDKNGKEKLSSEAKADDGTFTLEAEPITDQPTEIEILKTDTEAALSGAKLALYRFDADKKNGLGDQISEWTSNEKAKTLAGELTEKEKYVLAELSAPKGYEKAENIYFSLDGEKISCYAYEDGRLEADESLAEKYADGIRLTMEDKKPPVTPQIRLILQKKGSDTKKGLEGAVYGLYQEMEDEDALIEQETSDEDGYMTFTDAQPGNVYYFKEISSPTGYTVDHEEGVHFTVKVTEDGKAAIYSASGKKQISSESEADDGTYILMAKPVSDQPTIIEILKIDGEAALKGAKLALYSFDAGEKDGLGDQISEWTSNEKAKNLTGQLTEKEKYVLAELSAPKGYEKAENIYFSLEGDKISCYSYKDGKLKADKKLTKKYASGNLLTMTDKKAKTKKGKTVNKTKKTRTVRTGDDFPIALMTGIFAASAAGIFWALRRRKNADK